MTDKIDFLVSIDATGSMYSCLREIRRRVSDLIKNSFDKFPDIRIGMILHGNLEDQPILERLEFSQNSEALQHFIETVPPKSGGGVYHYGIGNPACYELVLKTANEWYWRPDAKKYMLMIGDVDAHKIGESNSSRIVPVKCETDWKEELRKVAEQGISIFAVQCLDNRNATSFWKTLASTTNGKYVELNQLSQVFELLTLAIYSVHDEKLAEDYAQTLSLNRGFQQLANQVLGKQTFTNYTQVRQDGLVPVPLGRFQLLHVDEGDTIQNFVNRSNLGKRYKTGKGFYQLTKSELVQENKEVIVVDKITGDMFSGTEARNIIGIPFGERGKANPHLLNIRKGQYDVFVQSTSYTRKLMPNTMFLYEVNK